MLSLYSMLGMQLIPFYSILRTYHTILSDLLWMSTLMVILLSVSFLRGTTSERATWSYANYCMTISHLAFFRVDAQGFLVSRA